MKKLFNGRFLFILATSIVVLMLLTIGAFYLFDDEDNTFVKSGYILNPLSSTSEKYFFDENVGYKENLSSMIEFVDIDENKVTVLKDSFLHYSDESMSFLKKGAILDLDSIKGEKAVSFYNISNESIINKKDSGYYITSMNGEIKLVNFIGRISDNKYIVVGDLSLKMAGNETIVKGNYFEVVYIEAGIVNIENKDVKFQVASEDAVISVGTKLKVDLGDKKITYEDKDVMSITSITIDGDENIEIVPKVEEDDDTEEKPQGGNGGNGTGTGTGNGGGAGAGNGNGNAAEDTGNNDGEITDPTNNILITLKDAKIGSTDIDVVFEILNATNNDSFKLQVVNLSSGRTVDMIASVINNVQIQVNLLTPNTKYLFMVINEKDNAKYFQKVLETSGFGIKLEKEYATNNSLSYKISFDEDADISNAKLTLYKFNEESKVNEIVKTCYTDTATGEETCQEKIFSLSSLLEKLSGEHSVLFGGLESDTIYTAVLDEFSVASYNFKDIYNITLTSMTLKEVPTFTEMVVEKNVGTGSFDLSLGNIKDPDNAITSYTYMVYDKFTDNLAIEPIVHKNASPLNVLIGEGVNKLKNDTNYYYKVVIEYFDNEKYIEYVTSDSIVFIMGDDPYVTVTPREDLITHNTIGATIYLIDNSCLVSMPGREKCNGASSTVVEVSRINPLTGERVSVFTREVEFEVTEEDIKYNLYLENLQPGNTYNITVRSKLNNSSSDTEELLHTDSSKRNISTKYLSSFNVNWENYQSSATHVVNAGVKFTSVENSSTESPEETLNKIDKVILKLYQGERPTDFTTVAPIKTVEISKEAGVNFKETIFDAFYVISSSDTFGMSMTQLKKLNAENAEDKGKLSEYYTLLIQAEVDGNPVTLINPTHQYKISSLLLLDGVEEPVIKVTNITNSMFNKRFSNLTNGGTIVGYNITAAYDLANLVGYEAQSITYYVYDKNNKPLRFYYLNGKDELVETEGNSITFNLDVGFHETNIYMNYGTEYEQNDSFMSRGNTFKIGYIVGLKQIETGETLKHPNHIVDPDAPSAEGIFKTISSEKETPSIKMYMSKSTSDSVIYKYEIKDPDNAIYKDPTDESYSMFYTVNGGTEQRYDLIPVEDASFNQFKGDITIDGLVKNDTYKIYYKKNVSKTDSFDKDVLNYIDDAYKNGDRIFEGYYDSDSVKQNYNFTYKILNDPDKDNKVGIKILAHDEIRKRIVNYQLVFTAKYADGRDVLGEDGKPVKLIKELWELSSCSDDTSKKCLYVDYTELKKHGMKSEWDGATLIEKKISVSVTAYYDNGLSGFDYKVGNTTGDDYLYCIMQDDLIKNDKEVTNTSGSYIVLNSSGNSSEDKIEVWDGEGPKGYYTYSKNGSLLELNSHLLAISGQSRILSINLTSSGYSSKPGYINPKMITVQEMEIDSTSSDKTFMFVSITPTVTVSRKAGLVNGTILKLSLAGVDVTEVFEESGNYYVYVETLSKQGYLNSGGFIPDNSTNTVKFNSILCNENSCNTARPVVAVPINKNNSTASIDALIDGLSTNTKYYFQIYIKKKAVNSSGYTYTQLFDGSSKNSENTTYAYGYKTGTASELFKNVSLGLSISDEKYGDRNLDTVISLNEYSYSVPFNFDVAYVLCDSVQVNAGVCGIKGDTNVEGAEYTNIFEKKIPQSNVKKEIKDVLDISAYDLEYGKVYYVYVYAVADYYSLDETSSNFQLQKVNIRINTDRDPKRTLRLLVEPTFEVTREAGYDGENYYIDFNVTVKDPDRTLIDGVYYVKLTDSNRESLLGKTGFSLQIKNADGDYETVPADTAFDALEVGKTLRVIGSGLEENTKYLFTVYNDVYINNYSEDPEKDEKEERTYEISRSYTVYTSNTYGVSFGNIIYNVTSNSFIITFLGGSNFDNVVGLSYSIEVVDSLSTEAPVGGEYEIGDGKDQKQIEILNGSSEYQFTINPDGMKNQLGSSYNIVISVDINTPSGTVHLSNTEYPGFNGTVVYVQEKK